tara:strand:+ start:2454 stop:3212 length:759 start_codon:yes stop_codon:yes gene_type:complete
MENETIEQESNNQSLATIDVALLAEDEGAGLENVSSDDLLIPSLKLVQKGSPFVDPTESTYTEEVKVGDIINSVTNEFYSGSAGVTVVPAAYRRVFLEYVPREAGGGLAGFHEDPAILAQTHRDEMGKDVLPSGNYIQTTANHYVLLVEGEKYTPVMVAMYSSQLKKSRRWNSIMAGQRIMNGNKSIVPASYSHKYHLSTVAEKNSKGSWFGWKIDAVGRVDDINLYNTAKEFAKSTTASEVTTATPTEESF